MYAYLYLFEDYGRSNDLVQAATFLLKAENLAKTTNNVGWQGWVATRRGTLNTLLQNGEKIITSYQKAVALCGIAKDSLCVGEALEQIGAAYAQMDSFQQANLYFDRALPILKNHASDFSLGVMYNNYGILLSRQNRSEEAITYMEIAIASFKTAKRYLEPGKVMNNLADAYRRLGQLEDKDQKNTLQEASDQESPDFEHLYNQRILTPEDWAIFKVHFEKTYPGYLLRLRSVHSTLSEAEERLFLFLKLQLTRKEIADILGISPDSVKKARTRLRKRLELEREDSLEDFVQSF